MDKLQIFAFLLLLFLFGPISQR